MKTKCLTSATVAYGINADWNNLNDADWSDLNKRRQMMDGWTITLTNCNGESEEFWFWTGYGLRGTEPTVADLVRTLVLDASCLVDEPEELNDAEKKAIEQQNKKAMRLFGSDYWLRLTEMSDEEIEEIFGGHVK